MTEVASPMNTHPGPMSRDPGAMDRSDSEDSVEKELDWLIQRAEAPSPEPVSTGKSVSPRGSASPRGSPRSPPPPAQDDDDDHYVPERPKSRTGSEDDEDTAPEYDGEDFDMSQMTDDQRQAMIELQHMKLDLAYTTDEEPPEYDVTERLRQLNAELEQEPMPEDDSRARSIKFQEDPVSLVVPPDNYSDTEEDDQSPQDMADNQDSQNKLDSPEEQRQDLGGSGDGQQQDSGDQQQDSGGQQQDSGDRLSPQDGADGSGDAPSSKGSDQDSEDWQGREEPESTGHRHYSDSHDYEEAATSDGEEEEGSKDTEQTANKSEGEDTQQQQRRSENNEDSMVVVERNGKFEHVNVNDLTAEERELYGVQTEEDKEEKKVHEPKPPSHPRPSTANNAQQRRGGRGAPRSTSAMGHSSTDSGTSDFNYKSPYAMTDEEKKRRLKEQNEQERQKSEEEKARKEQEDRDRADAEDAFQAWLSNKRKEAQEKRKQEKENQKRQQGEKKGKEPDDDDTASNTSSFQDQDRDSAFKEWLKVKKDKKKEQQQQEKKMVQDYDEGYYVRSRSECNKAFKEWLKKKNSDLRRQQQEEMAKARVHKLLARKSRKSQQLAKAIKQAQAFKYVDYYGYRY